MWEAAIFDIDGTLVDSVDFHAESWQRVFRQFGHEIPYADIRSQIGKGGDQLLPVFLSREEVEKRGAEIEKAKGELYKREYLPRIRPFPKVRDLFRRILDDGKRIALASSSDQDEVERLKKISGVADLLDADTSADDAERSKPHPDIFAAALEKLGGAHSIVIGDSPYDAEAARKLGVHTVGLLCGGFPEADLRAAGCVAVFRDPAHLLENYGRFAAL